MTDPVQQQSCLQTPLGNTLQDVCQVIAMPRVHTHAAHIYRAGVCVRGGVELQLVCWDVRDVGVMCDRCRAAIRLLWKEHQQQVLQGAANCECGCSQHVCCHCWRDAHACHTAVMLSFLGALTEPSIAWQPIAPPVRASPAGIKCSRTRRTPQISTCIDAG